jgi:hypothetical protein
MRCSIPLIRVYEISGRSEDLGDEEVSRSPERRMGSSETAFENSVGLVPPAISWIASE